ncbi:MAG: LysR family transcriptional regulator [Halobacteriovoraceae bacterium]|nr:LysR family transcriptional regulator [Halobacteriovoraceae bacterium]
MSLRKKINFNNLYYFHVIAQEGSLAKATKFLDVSQPTLSQQLKHLENQLGIELFIRKGRSLQLSHEGSIIFEHTKKIFSMASVMLEDLQRSKEVKKNKMSGPPENLADNHQ